ncbi:MAG TPA: SRPBCC domain-containing protein [Allosphingosinicella sp.]|nr:SRPBCC domain-containing protein [Allosphingosinicella sp.]
MKGVTLVRHIKARPSTVFDLLSTAEGLTSWWGPDDFPVIAAAADVRVGGRFRVRFRTIDGAEHICVGEFLEIVPPVRLVMSWRWFDGGVPEEKGRTSRVKFHVRPDGAGTELTLIHAGLCDADSERSHEGGWTGALDKLCRGWTA